MIRSDTGSGVAKGATVTKGKKKKKNKNKKQSQSAGLFSPKVARRLQDISRNPLVADVVAATLIGAASALRDSKKAHQLAASAGDELEELAHRGAKSGNALWQLALDVGRKSLEALAGESSGAKPPKSAARSSAKAAAPSPVVKKAAAAPKKRKSASPANRQSTRPPAR